MPKRLAIIVGHTKKSPGARAVAPIAQHEYEWNSDFAEKMVSAIAGTYSAKQVEAEVFFRDRGGIAGAYGRAKEWGADAAVELHFNSASPKASGSEVLYYTAPSKPLANVVHAATRRVLELRDRGIKTPYEASGDERRGQTNLSQMGARPSVLTESFFGSNPHDASIAHERKDDLAAAQALAAVEYLLAPYDNGDDVMLRVAASALNVRGGPGITYEKLDWGPLKRDQKVLLLRRSGDWCKVQHGSDETKQGFVHGDWLA